MEPSDTPTPPAAPSRARRPFLILGGIAGVGAAAWVSWSLWTWNVVATDDAQIEAEVVAIAPRVGGHVLHVTVHNNQAVHAGDVLIELDPVDLADKAVQAAADLAAANAAAAAADAQVEIVTAQSRGGLSTATAQVSSSNASVKSAAAQVTVAEAALQRAQIDARKAAADFERVSTLRDGGGVTPRDVDAATAARDATQAAVAQATAGLTVAQQQLAASKDKVAEAEGRADQSAPVDAAVAVVRAQADLAHARARSAEAAASLAARQLEYATVKAPFDGTVSVLSTQEGQIVAPGQPIGELVPNVSFVVANFKETQVGALKAGQPAVVTVDAFPGHPLVATVDSISAATGSRFSLLPADNASGNFVKVVQRVAVKLVWTTPPDVTVRAGMSAEVSVNTR